MLVSPDGDVVVSNDGATIMENMDVCLFYSLIIGIQNQISLYNFQISNTRI